MNTGVTFTATGEQHECIAAADGQLEERPNATITAGGVEFAYRELGTNNSGTPVVFLVHLAAVLDNWDPRVVDGFAASRHVITFDNRGIGASSGAPATSIEHMAKDAITGGIDGLPCGGDPLNVRITRWLDSFCSAARTAVSCERTTWL